MDLIKAMRITYGNRLTAEVSRPERRHTNQKLKTPIDD